MPYDRSNQSLLDLLGSPGLSNMNNRPGRTPNIGRNQAAAQYAANSLGDPSLADGSISQVDLQDAQQGQQNDALRKLIMPIRERGDYALAEGQQHGQFAVEAARQSQIGQMQRDERLYGRQSALQDDRQAATAANAATTAATATKNRDAMTRRAAANAKAASLRQQQAAVLKEKASSGLFGWGDTQTAKDQKLATINADLEAALAEAAGAEVNDPSEAPVDAGAPPAAAGGGMAARLAAYKAARGR